MNVCCFPHHLMPCDCHVTSGGNEAPSRTALGSFVAATATPFINVPSNDDEGDSKAGTAHTPSHPHTLTHAHTHSLTPSHPHTCTIMPSHPHYSGRKLCGEMDQLVGMECGTYPPSSVSPFSFFFNPIPILPFLVPSSTLIPILPCPDPSLQFPFF